MAEESAEARRVRWPAKVIEVVDEYRVVINRGSRDGINAGQRFIIYGLGAADLVDPDTGESLGQLEIVRGTGSATHVQEKVSTITSTRTASAPKRTVRRSNPTFVFGGATETETIQESSETLPFSDPAKGDHARPV